MLRVDSEREMCTCILCSVRSSNVGMAVSSSGFFKYTNICGELISARQGVCVKCRAAVVFKAHTAGGQNGLLISISVSPYSFLFTYAHRSGILFHSKSFHYLKPVLTRTPKNMKYCLCLQATENVTGKRYTNS